MADTATKTYEDILYRVEDGVAVVTPQPSRQARTPGAARWTATSAPPCATPMTMTAVKVIILTGAGKGFCAGRRHEHAPDASSPATPSHVRSAVDAHKPWDPTANENFQKQYSWLPAVQKPIIAGHQRRSRRPRPHHFALLRYPLRRRQRQVHRPPSRAAASSPNTASPGCFRASWVSPAAADLLYSARVINARRSQGHGPRLARYPRRRLRSRSHGLRKRCSPPKFRPRSLREMKREIWNAQFQTLGAGHRRRQRRHAALLQVRRLQGRHRALHGKTRTEVHGTVKLRPVLAPDPFHSRS